MEITIMYVFLHILLLFIFYIGGKKLDSDKGSSNYGFVTSVLILCYTIEEGLRWGRGIDWCHYYMKYTTSNLDDYEFLFRIWWSFSHYVGIPYPFVICICSGLFVFSLLFFYRPYKGYYQILYPLSVAYSSVSASNLIRWFIPISIILISLRFFLDGEKTKSILFVLLVPLFHFGAIPLVFLVLGVLLVKTYVKAKYVIILSVIFVLFFNSSIFLFFNNSISILFASFDKFSGYINDIDGWLTGDVQHGNLERKSSFVYLISLLPFYLTLVCSEKLLKIESGKIQIIHIYNLSSVAVLMLSISSGLEIMSRFVDVYYPIISIMISFAIVHTKDFFKRSQYKFLLCAVVLYTFVGYKFWIFIKPLDKEFKMCYVWNANKHPMTIFSNY